MPKLDFGSTGISAPGYDRLLDFTNIY